MPASMPPGLPAGAELTNLPNTWDELENLARNGRFKRYKELKVRDAWAVGWERPQFARVMRESLRLSFSSKRLVFLTTALRTAALVLGTGRV